MPSTARPSNRRRGRPPATPSRETRARILHAARHCFAETGYARTTNRQIAGSAGVTAAALYNHFPSKAALFVAAFEAAQGELVRRYRRAVAGKNDAVRALCAIVDASARADAEDPSLTRFMSVVMTEMRSHEDLRAGVGRVPNRIGALIAELVSEGRRSGRLYRRIPAQAVVEMLIAAIAGLALASSEKPPESHPGMLRAFRALLAGNLVKNN